MRKVMQLGVLSLALTLGGCASGLNSQQERQYSTWEQEGVLIEEKSPGTGAALGLLPGGGSFYARETGLGVVNLLLWPISIFWDPVSGHNGAKAINYDLTQHHLKKEKLKAMNQLNDRLMLGELDQQQFVMEKRRIDAQYDF